MYLDKKCRLVHYIPHKVKDNFRRNPTQMLNYFKQIGGNEGKLGGFSGGFSDNIHKLVEQIEFLSCNLQHYDYIINKYTPHILWLKISKSQFESKQKMDLIIDSSHSPKARATTYGIYKVLELQEKFGLNVVAGIRNLG